MMQLKAGARLRSVADSAEIIVVKAPSDDVDLRCGGHPLIPLDSSVSAGQSVDPAHSSGTQIGKRYVDATVGLEVLCTKAGDGSLAVGDEPLELKDAKPLPASD
jgi:hypothetical protein